VIRRTFLALAALALIPVGVAGKDAAEAEFVPDVASGRQIGAPPLVGATWTDEGPGYTMRLQRITDEQRQAFFRRMTESPTDPFASRPDEPPRYQTFLLQIENKSDGSLMFQSKHCWLKTDRNELLTPIGLGGLRSSYGVMGREMAPAYESVAPAVLEGSVTLQPGESIAGTLVYKMFKPKTSFFKIDVQLTTSAGDVVKLVAPYRRHKPNGKKR
jgi:hypothetical protein